jgi:hypothetical protein
MLPDLAKLSEDELIELNRRIVERLNLLRSAKSLLNLRSSPLAWLWSLTPMTVER